MKIIGLGGRAGAGKDTVASRIEALLDSRWTVNRISFAAPLKQSVAALFDITVEDVERAKIDHRKHVTVTTGWRPHEFEPNAEEWLTKDFTMREILQRYGTEAHRNIFGENFWVEQGMNKIDTRPFVCNVFTDVRFPNEAEAIKQVGGRVFEVKGLVNGATPAHSSETPLPARVTDGFIINVERHDDYVTLDSEVYPLLYQGPPRDPERRKEFIRDLRAGLV